MSHQLGHPTGPAAACICDSLVYHGPVRVSLWALLCCLLLAGYGAPASAQFSLQESFTGTTAPGWTLEGDAELTAAAGIDPVGEGWLRLTDVGYSQQGQALDTTSFASSQSVVLKFSFVSWGGVAIGGSSTGADGISVFLYDPTQGMSGTVTGGGLGYCHGVGGYLAIGLDEFGNFSNTNASCGPTGIGLTPESLVIRGPYQSSSGTYTGNPYVTGVSVPGGIDNPDATTRPSPKTVLLTLTPATSPAVGYTITAQIQTAASGTWQTLFSNVPFPYTPPANLAVGFAASTGADTNYHELQGLAASTPDDIQVTMTGPSTILPGAPVTYAVTVTNNGSYDLESTNAPTVTDTLPAAITDVTWTCTGSAGATCDASGSGNIDTSDVTLPANASVTYTITGMLDAGTSCSQMVTNSANADFGSSSTFTDPNETNNTASVSSTVSCTVTLAANPSSLSFGTQTMGVASSAQAITVTGINGAMISGIATSGDFSQTNNCTAALSGTSCTINAVFTPSVEGSESGSLSITSSAASSPTVIALSGTGTNTVPDAFSFAALNNVDPGSVQASNAITVAGTNASSTISVSDGAEYNINGGAFTSVPGVVSPGAQVQVELTASLAYSTAVSAVLTIGGVDSTFTVTTRAQPVLSETSVTSGGGVMGPLGLLVLGVVTLISVARRRALLMVAVGATAAGMLSGNRAEALDYTAFENSYLANVYVGFRVGETTSTLTAAKLTSSLQSDGYDVEASDVGRNDAGGTVYAGYEILRNLGLEIGWTDLGRTRAELQGIAPANLGQLLHDAAHITDGDGDAWSLAARYRWEVAPRVAMDLRAGPYLWDTHSEIWIGSTGEDGRADRGMGYTLGLGPRYALGERFGLGLGVDYFASTASNRFVQVSATFDYRFH